MRVYIPWHISKERRVYLHTMTWNKRVMIPMKVYEDIVRGRGGFTYDGILHRRGGYIYNDITPRRRGYEYEMMVDDKWSY